MSVETTTVAEAAAPATVKVNPETGYIQHEQKAKDWSYLLAKDPSDLHALHVRIMKQELGEDNVNNMTQEQFVMAYLAMHRWMQKSDANQARPEFKGRRWNSVLKGSETLGEKAATIIVEKGEDARVVETPVAINLQDEAVAEEEAPKPKPRRTRSRKAAATAEEIAASEEQVAS